MNKIRIKATGPVRVNAADQSCTIKIIHGPSAKLGLLFSVET